MRSRRIVALEFRSVSNARVINLMSSKAVFTTILCWLEACLVIYKKGGLPFFQLLIVLVLLLKFYCMAPQ